MNDTTRFTGTRRTTMAWLAFGYFATYIPYAAVVKGLSGGFLPGIGAHKGLALLPAAAIGQLLVMPVFLYATGWWRYGSRRRVRGHRLFFPKPAILASGLVTALIVGTTTLNFTFPGVSIIFMLLMMRAGTLIVGPIVDKLVHKRVHGYSWAAVGFALAAVVIALADVHNYSLTFWAAASVLTYIAAYLIRFKLMDRHAKSGVLQVDRRYFVGEHAAAPVLLFLLLAVGAVIGQPSLREGFTTLLASKAALPAMAIGVCYEALFIFGTLIFLDHNEYAWTVPINNCGSLLSGLVASFGLFALFPAAKSNLPGKGQLLSLVAIFFAILMLCYPAIRQRIVSRSADASAPVTRRLILFVCDGNRCRSPMAEAIAREEVARTRSSQLLHVGSAGVRVSTVGGSMSREAVIALGDLGIEVQHAARALTPAMCAKADVIYCMSRANLDLVLAMAPDAATRTFCLDPGGDLSDPTGQSPEAHRQFALQLQGLIRPALADQLTLQLAAGD